MARKATRAELKEHNRRLVLRAVYRGAANSRAALAQYTGLSKPSVSDIVSDLMNEGLLVEGGRGKSTESGGKRPRLLEFQVDAREIIGVTIGHDRIFGVLVRLDGTVRVRHDACRKGAQGEDALTVVEQVINGLLVQRDAPLLAIGLGAPGIVDGKAGVVRVSPPLGWHEFPLGQRLQATYDVPVHISNNTELATRAQIAFASRPQDICDLVMILVNSSLEIGITFGGRVYHHSGDLGFLRGGKHLTQPLSALLGWEAVQQRVAQLRDDYPGTALPTDDLSYLHLQQAYRHGDALSARIYDELAAHLAQVFAWITGLIRPEQVVLAGDITDLGPPLIDLAVARSGAILPAALLDAIAFSLSRDPTLTVRGAVALVLGQELGVL